MVQQFLRATPTPNRHDQRVCHELRGHSGLHRPADDSPRVQVEHRGDVQPAFRRPEVGEVGDPFLVRRVRLELAVQNVLGQPGALARVLRQSATPRPRPQRLTSHQPFHPMQSAAFAQGEQVMPDPPRPVGPVACQEALPYLAAESLVLDAASTPRSRQPGIEATARDTKRRAHIRSTGQAPRCFATKPNLTSTPWRNRPRPFFQPLLKSEWVDSGTLS